MFKKPTPDEDHRAIRAAQLPDTLSQQPVKPASTPVSCIGSAMSIVGNVVCSGPAQVFGCIEGELRASDLVIGEGGHVEGSIQAQDITINGVVKGTVRAVRVRLQGATVEGDIIHRTLSIDENSIFNGVSRRVDEPLSAPAEDAQGAALNAAAEPAPTRIPAGPSLVPLANGHLQPH
jgi:cytoskeletal protein CcmA (bactofilin family)